MYTLCIYSAGPIHENAIHWMYIYVYTLKRGFFYSNDTRVLIVEESVHRPAYDTNGQVINTNWQDIHQIQIWNRCLNTRQVNDASHMTII